MNEVRRLTMSKKIIATVAGIIILLMSVYCIRKIKINYIVSNCTYIGKEYRYTIDTNNEHRNRQYYEFYINNQDNTVFCIENNNKSIRIKNIEELETLYYVKINCLVMDETTYWETYDENNNESSGYYLKNKMFPNEESDYLYFTKNEGE